MEHKFDVAVYGSCIIDFISYVPRIPRVGETIHGTKFETGYGGKGANQAVAAAKLGSRTAIISKLGHDSWGKDYKNHLERERVNTEYLEIVNGESTGIAQINVSQNGDNQIVIVVGANNRLSTKDVDESFNNILSKSKTLLCQLETPIEGTIEALRQFKGISILNAAPGLANIPLELLSLSTIFCLNETEAELVTGLEIKTSIDTKDALLKLLSMGCNTVILTLGEKGAAFCTKSDSKPKLVKAPKIKVVVDTTGAGDAFLGALGHVHATHPDIPLYKKIGISCEIASQSVQIPGTQKSFPRMQNSDFEKLVNKDYECLQLTEVDF